MVPSAAVPANRMATAQPAREEQRARRCRSTRPAGCRCAAQPGVELGGRHARRPRAPSARAGRRNIRRIGRDRRRAASACSRSDVVRPGIMSTLPPRLGTQKLWMTSRGRQRRTRPSRPTGMRISLALSNTRPPFAVIAHAPPPLLADAPRSAARRATSGAVRAAVRHQPREQQAAQHHDRERQDARSSQINCPTTILRSLAGPRSATHDAASDHATSARRSSSMIHVSVAKCRGYGTVGREGGMHGVIGVAPVAWRSSRKPPGFARRSCAWQWSLIAAPPLSSSGSPVLNSSSRVDACGALSGSARIGGRGPAPWHAAQAGTPCPANPWRTSCFAMLPIEIETAVEGVAARQAGVMWRASHFPRRGSARRRLHDAAGRVPLRVLLQLIAQIRLRSGRGGAGT